MAPKTARPRSQYPRAFKLEVVNYAVANSGRQASLKYKVDRVRIREWIKQKPLLIASSTGKAKRKRLAGAGRKVKYPELEEALHKCILMEREAKRSVSTAAIFAKAKRLFQDDGKVFSSSRGWFERFADRKHLSIRRKTTTAQRPPSDYVDKLVDFVLYIRKLRQENNYQLSGIIGCDETAVWLDMASETMVATTGEKDIVVKTTGHEKVRITVMLTAKADGTKLKPFVLFNRKRRVKELEQFRGKLFMKFKGTTWMNDELTTDYIREVLGNTLSGRRLLVWDSFNCHINDKAKNELRPRKIDMAVVPGGCTKYAQPADVSWNKPFKDHLRARYSEWMASDNLEYTKGGNLRPVPLTTVCEWIISAWDGISTEIIRKSFKSCGISVAVNGSEDDQITMFKEGRSCEIGRELLKTKHTEASQELEEDEEEALEMTHEEPDSDDDLMEEEHPPNVDESSSDMELEDEDEEDEEDSVWEA